MSVDANACAPSADAGTFSTPPPRMRSMRPPPRLLCLSVARGMPGKAWTVDASAAAVSARP